MLLIMGVAGHHRMWGERFLARLAETFDVVAYDHRGIGESHRAEDEFTIPDLASDAAAVLDSLGWETAHVVGISMGGVIAQELALTHPERVRSLTLGCTWPGPGDVWGDGVAGLAEAAADRDPETATRKTFEINVSSSFAANPAHFDDFQEIALSVRVPSAVVMMQLPAAAAHDARDRLPGLDTPTLVIHGRGDAIIRHHGGEELASLIPDAKLEIWDGVGHLFFWEEPDRAADAITAHAVAHP